MKDKIKHFLFFIVSMTLVMPVYASNGVPADTGHGMIDRLAGLAFQLALILFAAKLGGKAFEKIKLPGVLGEILAGVLIGPFCLGAIALPGFANGIFPLAANFPVSIELYSIATIASIVLLFLVGLETDIDSFMQYSVAGSVIGIGGVLISFIIGDYTIVLFSEMFLGKAMSFADPIPLFMGVLSTATSVGITARILSEKRKMDAPEGVTILAGAVIDDVLGIIVLAIVLGIIKSGHVDIKSVSAVAVKTVGIWLGFTVAGLVFARKISFLLKKLKNRSTIALMAFALAMLLAGIFEKSGLAMIIGAYTMGLSLSKTDIAFMVQDNLSELYQFFVPVFFCVMGMLVNLKAMANINVVAFGLIFTVSAVIGKLLGCSVPALFLNFNVKGALRVGLGMVPRGEVALIMAGVGLSAGVLAPDTFSIAVVMTFLTTLITPPLLSKLLEDPGSVLKKELETKSETVDIPYSLPNAESAQLILNKIIEDFEEEGFYVHLMHHGEGRVYQIRKKAMFITMQYKNLLLTFTCQKKDKAIVQTLFYEVLAEIEAVMRRLQTLTDRKDIGKQIFADNDHVVSDKERKEFLHNVIALETTTVSLKTGTKMEIIDSLLELLVQSGKLDYDNKDKALVDVLERENTMSTGMQDGIALPHTKSDAVDGLYSAIGIIPEGVDFESLDGQPANIFVMTLASKCSNEPYLEYLAEVSKVLMDSNNREKILACKTNAQLYHLFLELM